MTNKYIAAKAKVLKRLENGTYELGFQCPDCTSGWVTMIYNAPTGTIIPLTEGSLIDVKIGKIVRGETLQIEPYVEIVPDADWMPAIMMLARDAGIVEEPVDLAEWTTAYINELPDSSFAYVEPCYGKENDNKNARHLPYKDKGGAVDLPHLRNALARVNQIKLICDGDVQAAIAHARSKLEAAAKHAGVGKYTVLQSFINLATFEPPATGDAPTEVKRIVDTVYSSCRQRWVDSHPSDKENTNNKTSCSRIAWGAVHKAGWKKSEEGKWEKLVAVIPVEMHLYKLKDNETGKILVGLSENEIPVDTLADGDEFSRVAEENQMADFTLIHHWWGNGDQYEHYDLFINTDPQTHMVLMKNPLKDTEFKAIQRKPYTENFWQKGVSVEQIAPGQPGNPSNTMLCSIERVDTGKVALYENAAQPNNEWLARMEFFGSKMEGRWSFTSSTPNIWNALKETTKLTDMFPLDIQLSGGISGFTETPEGLIVEGKALSFGVWNGMYWSPDVIKNSPVSDFDNMLIDVEHRNNAVAGKVLEKRMEGADINVKFLVNDYEIAEKIKQGEYKGLSIDAIVFGDPVRRVITGVKQYKRLTVCHNPACKVCYIGNCNI
jgi:hypothetical protein